MNDITLDGENIFAMTAKGRAWVLQALGEEAPVAGLANTGELADLAEEDGLTVNREEEEA